MSTLIDNAWRAIHRYGMALPGQLVLAAVSGGPDSIAMLHVLRELAPELGIRLAVAHLDHGFRPESGDEASFVENAAKSLGLACVVEKAGLGELLAGRHVNKQAAAREARYGFLERIATGMGAARIAVGHTADDQAETYLMRGLRGSGVQGLSAIPPVRGKVVRPLIEAGRDEVITYLKDRKIAYVTDPTNLQPGYTRNRLRLNLLPILREYNPQVVAALTQSADILREEDEFLDAYTKGLMPGLTAGNQDGGLALDLPAFLALPTAIKRRVIRLAIARVKGDRLGIGYAHVIDAVRVVSAGGTGRGIDLPGVRVEQSYDRLLIFSRGRGTEGFSRELPVPGRVEIPEVGVIVQAELIHLSEIKEPAGPDTALFDMDRLKGPLTVRSRRPGDFFFPVGMTGRKKLTDFFIDLKIPRAQRSRIPVLDWGGEIAWVMGLRLDRRYKADDSSRRVLRITLLPL